MPLFYASPFLVRDAFLQRRRRQDVAAFQKYAEEVDLYVKACQHYIDGATNDANAIIEARNKAVKKAQEAVDVYNRFFDK